METNQAIQDILETVTFLKDHAASKEDLNGVKDELNGVKDELNGVKDRLTKVEATMVTKDYLDDKLSDLKGDLVILMRKEDRKVSVLVEVLRAKQLLSEEEAKRILTMEPFPQIL